MMNKIRNPPTPRPAFEPTIAPFTCEYPAKALMNDVRFRKLDGNA